MDNQLAVVSIPTTTPYEELLIAQSDLIRNQIEIFEGIVSKQCEPTGVNPLSQEMAAGALSIKIEKKPRDLLNPKALKYLHLVFSIKDAISKRETRDISSQFGVTLTQVRDFFACQRTRVRKYARLSKDKVNQSPGLISWRDSVASSSDQSANMEPIPFATISPMNIDEGSSCSAQDEVRFGMDELDKPSSENILTLMRKEETFVGQVKLLDQVLRMDDPSAIDGFLNEGGLMILATWLTQAVTEEQTSVVHVMLKVLYHLPLEKAPPAHMSAILQSVNRLRFYRTSDLSHRAKSLLSKWSKMFQKSQSRTKSACNTPDELLLMQSINEVIGTGSWDSNKDNSEEAPRPLCNDPNNRKVDSPQPPKMLMASEDNSNKRRGVLASHTRERRKVQMVEHPGQRPGSRSPQVAKSALAVRSRPISADDIQKAKLRAQYMQGKLGKIASSPEEQQKPESQSRSASQDTVMPVNSRSDGYPELVEKKELDNVVTKYGDPHDNLPVEPPWKKCKSIQIPWRTPPEISLNDSWCVASGADSKEVEVQRNRTLREREVIYYSNQEIPPNPKEPWDREMDYDDTLTPPIPIEQLPDVEPLEAPPSAADSGAGNVITTNPSSSSSMNVPGPDLELLEALLKNPDLVFALTSGQAGNMPSDQIVKVLDMVKAKSSDLGGSAGNNVEVSLPSPTPSTNAFPNVPKPDFSKNPFSKMHSLEDADAFSVQPFSQATTVLAAQPFATAHVVVPSVHAAPTLLHGQWHPTANLPMHHQSTQRKFSNTQHLTPEMMMNMDNNMAHVTSNVLGASSSVIRNETLVSLKPHSTSASTYSQEHRQGFQSGYQHQNNTTTMNNYNSYTGQLVNAKVPTRDDRDGLRGRPEYESWSPNSSPSRRRDYLPPGQYHQEPREDTGYGYGPERAARQNGYKYHGVGGAGNRNWNDHRR